MSEKTVDMNIVRLAVDTYKGVQKNYSTAESLDTLRKAAVETNNGKTYLDYRDIRDGRCSGLFRLIETIIVRSIPEGFQGDEFFNTLVEYRNVAEGDKNEFEIEDSDLFVVAKAANGTQGIRRQRLGGSEKLSIPTTLRIVKIYEELDRLLAGRSDMNKFIQKVVESFKQQIWADTYSVFMSATSADFGGTTYFPAAGSYDEDTLLDIISHTEAAAGGKSSVIVTTKKTARLLVPAIQGNESKSDIYNLGYYGKFYGTPILVMPQRHKIGFTEFVIDDNVINIVAGDDKPIKFIYEGQGTILLRDAANNADFTQEYTYGEKYGIGFVMAHGASGNTGLGRYILK